MATKTAASGDSGDNARLKVSWEILRPRLKLPDTVWNGDRSVVTVSAPAGYGKTTLLSQWREQGAERDLRIVSLRASSGDRDGDKLLLDLAVALEASEAQHSESFLDRYGSAGQLAVVKALLAELDAQKQRAALFIDDAHELIDQPAESVLRLLLRYQPERLTLVVSGRTYPTGAVSRAMLDGRLARFDERQLALTRDEIASLLEQHSIQPRDKLVQKVLERTQGWPAAVRLVALTLQEDEQSQDTFVHELGEGPRALTDYLNEVLLSQQPEHLCRLLMQLSLLRRFTVPLAIAATGMEDAGALLEELESSGIPLARNSDLTPTYTLHPLVRDFLLAKLQQDGGHLLTATRDRAREWLIANDQLDSAIEVSLDGGDLDSAAALISEHAARMVQQYGRHTNFLYWINKFPPGALAAFPGIRLKQAWSLDFVRRHQEAESVLGELERADASTTPDYARPSDAEITLAIELQRCVQAGLRDHAQESVSRTQRWLARWPDASGYDKATAHTVLAFSSKALSDFTGGLRHARTALALGREVRGYYMLAWAGMLAVSNLVKQGSYRQALRECSEYLVELEPHLGNRSPGVMMLHAMHAGLLYEFNRLPDAGEALGQGLTALIEQSSADPMIMGFVTLARLQNLQRAPLEALETLAEGEALGWSRDLPRLAITLGAERVVMLLRHGEAEQAANLWDEVQRSATAGAASASFDKALEDKSGRIHARMAMLGGRHAEVGELLAPTLQHARRTGQKKKLVEALLLQAQALHAGEAQRAAQETMKEALSLAMPEGYLRTFADEGPPVRELIVACLKDIGEEANSPTFAYLQQLLGMLDGTDAATAPPEGSASSAKAETLIEPLTSRELQILAKLQSGLSNRNLADTLFITEGTLKWHLRNIYGKLGVASRLAAVARCRQLGLLNN